MRLAHFILLVMCLLIGSCFMGSSLLFLDSDSQGKTNLLPNHEFKIKDKKNHQIPDSWYIISSAENRIEPVFIDSLKTHSGGYSLKIVNPTKDLYVVSDAFRVNFTGGYYSRLYMSSSKPMQKKAKLYFWGYDAGGKKVNTFGKGVRTKGDWKRASISAGFLNNNISFARIAVFIPKDENNTYWIDDIGCYLVHQFTKE